MILTTEQKTAVAAYLTGCRLRTYELGQWDCGLFCADILHLLTGRIFANGYRGAYTTRQGYIDLLPVRLREMPVYLGLRRGTIACGSLWWMPGAHEEGDIGIVWQGRLLHPGRRGLIALKVRKGLETYNI